MKRFTVFLLFLALSLTAAQSVSARRELGALYVSLSDVAQELSYSVTDSGNSLTLRTPGGVLTLFNNSPDLDWTPAADNPGGEGVLSLSAPSFKVGDEWFAPLDVLDLLNISPGSSALTLPDGRSLSLDIPDTPQTRASANTALIDLGNGVTGLSFYKAGPAGKETLSLLVMDLGLMPLAFPEQQRELDRVMTALGTGKPLYFILTALSSSSWDASFRIDQGGRVVEYSHPQGVSILEGDPQRVAPGSPVSGVLLLPDWINLRRPLTVTWSGVTATVQYRR